MHYHVLYIVVRIRLWSWCETCKWFQNTFMSRIRTIFVHAMRFNTPLRTPKLLAGTSGTLVTWRLLLSGDRDGRHCCGAAGCRRSQCHLAPCWIYRRFWWDFLICAGAKRQSRYNCQSSGIKYMELRFPRMVVLCAPARWCRTPTSKNWCLARGRSLSSYDGIMFLLQRRDHQLHAVVVTWEEHGWYHEGSRLKWVYQGRWS